MIDLINGRGPLQTLYNELGNRLQDYLEYSFHAYKDFEKILGHAEASYVVFDHKVVDGIRQDMKSIERSVLLDSEWDDHWLVEFDE